MNLKPSKRMMITESDSGQNAYLEKVSSTLSVCTEETEPVKRKMEIRRSKKE